MEKEYRENSTKSGYTMVLESPYIMTGREYYDRYTKYSDVPEKIQEMLDMYEYGDGSFRKKCEVFRRQGMLMKDYEDTALWYGDLRRYFPVYHDLNIRQLRGYFAWRTGVRKRSFTRTCETFAYIYIYELLNGIGTESPEESFAKLEDFYRGYIETGMGDPPMKKYLGRWLTEFAVIHGMPKEKALRYADRGRMERDLALAVLQHPEDHADEEVFEAARRFASPKLSSSPVISKQRDKGLHLFAEIWRHLSGSMFTKCFGEVRKEPWHPLAGAVYYDDQTSMDMEYELTGSRKYVLEDGEWKEISVNSLTGDRTLFLEIMHMTDLKLRRMLKTGGYLRKKQGEDIAEELVDRALLEIKREAEEARRPKIQIDLSGLDRIREDAGETCESLLTEEETEPEEEEIIEETPEASTALNSMQTAVLRALLRETGEESSLMAEHHLMPEILADEINEALFDDIGDSVVECENDRLSLVPDYIEDVSRLVLA